jgi:hypothetical protein
MVLTLFSLVKSEQKNYVCAFGCKEHVCLVCLARGCSRASGFVLSRGTFGTPPEFEVELSQDSSPGKSKKCISAFGSQERVYAVCSPKA